MSRIIIFVTTAAVLACAWLGLTHFGTEGPGSELFAQTLEQVRKAKTITWKTTYYEQITSKDGKRTWLRPETREYAYKAPGLYRVTSFDKKGQVRSVEIQDSVHRKKLVMFLKTKEATLSEPVALLGDPEGPFDWLQKDIKEGDVQWVGKRKTPTGEVNVFRRGYKTKSDGRYDSYDFWIDQRTKQFVAFSFPGADLYDAEKELARNAPPETEWSKGTCPGRTDHDIVFDAELDDSLFRLEPPDGYTVKTEPRGQVTEKEMIDYLGILADFNDKTFPDQVFPFDISNDRVNKAWDKPKKNRTAAEQKLVETKDHYIGKFQRMPTSLFVEDHTVKDSFRYLGNGVKLGDKDAIVCWYKLKGAKNPNTYRVVYGDLSVKDVAPEDLPLPVGP